MAQKYLDINGLERYHDGLIEYMAEAVGTQADMSVKDPTNMAYIHNVPEWVRSETKPEYDATEVNADIAGTAQTEVSNHNISETAHEDIRTLIQEINTQIETKEVSWNDKYTKEEVDNKDAATLASAKEYNDTAYINANAYTDQKIADLINGAPATLDTLKEIADAMAENQEVVEALNEAIGTKASQIALDSHSNNADIHFTAAERTKLSGIATGANAYTHPSTHAASMITGLATVATSGNYNDLSNKPTIPTNTNQLTNGAGYITGINKTMVTNALGYTPPTTDTNTHYTTRIYAGASGTAANAAATSPYIKITDDNTYRNQLRLVGSGSVTVSSDANGNITIKGTDTNTTYSAATTSANGLMTAAMVTKLNGIATEANAYTHPSTHAASMITAGTFGATGVVAATGTDYTTNRVRNSVFTTTDPGAGASTTHANGSIICVYE